MFRISNIKSGNNLKKKKKKKDNSDYKESAKLFLKRYNSAESDFPCQKHFRTITKIIVLFFPIKISVQDND